MGAKYLARETYDEREKSSNKIHDDLQKNLDTLTTIQTKLADVVIDHGQRIAKLEVQSYQQGKH